MWWLAEQFHPDVPVDLYTRLVSQARKRGIPVALDASGPCFLAGLEGRPDFVKPNRVELEEAVGKKLDSLTDVYTAGKDLQKRYGCSLAITLGDDGAMLILPDKAYRVPTVAVEVVSTAGAGDGVLAGIAAGLSNGWPAEEGIRLGIAMAGAVCMQLATADCRKEDIEKILPQVKLIPFEG